MKENTISNFRFMPTLRLEMETARVESEYEEILKQRHTFHTLTDIVIIVMVNFPNVGHCLMWDT